MKKILICAVLFAAVLSGAFAQTSGLYQATAGLFYGDADNFMSVTDFGTVDFNKFYGFTSTTTTSSMVDAGFATKIKNIYLSVIMQETFLQILLLVKTLKQKTATTAGMCFLATQIMVLS